MILETIDFTAFFAHVRSIFSNHFSTEETDDIMEFVDILSDANFRCYKANMIVIKERKANTEDDKLMSDMEWVARSVGEYRVASKANINRHISNIMSVKQSLDPTKLSESWVNDDIVYSIGEMMDRLSIETIKREDFRVNNRPDHMRAATQELSDRVERYLRTKLKEVDEKGYYECIHEQRTYDLEGIAEELKI